MSKPNKLSQKAAPAAEPLLCYQVAEFSSPHGHPHNSRRNHNLPFQFISCQSKPKACIKMLYSRFPHTGNPISSRGSCFTSSWVKTSMAAADNWLVQSQLEEKGLWLNQATQNTEAGQLSEKIWFDMKNETDSVTKRQGIFLMTKHCQRHHQSLVQILCASSQHKGISKSSSWKLHHNVHTFS